MKKSRIFLSAALVIGITGAVLAKAHTRSVTYSYIDGNSTCQTASFADNTCPSGSFDCIAPLPGTSSPTYQLYEVNQCNPQNKILRN